MKSIQVIARQIEEALVRIEVAFEKFLPVDRDSWSDMDVLLKATDEYIGALETVGEYKGIRIVNYRDHLLAMLSVLPGVPGAAIVAPMNESVIIVNDEFEKLPEDLKEALLEHEYAHHMFSDITAIAEMGQDSYIRDCLRGDGAGFDIELRADAASKAAGFPIKEALTYLRTTMIDAEVPAITQLAIDSITLRIDAL